MATFLLDTNILLRMSDESVRTHLLAGEAVSKLLARGDDIYLTGQNLIEFWAGATRPVDANGFGWSTQRTATEVEQLRNKFPILPDSPQILPNWLRLVETHDIKGKKVHDTRLVAVMMTSGITHLLTCNTVDLRRFSNITLRHPNEIG
jgi:predicted nucleic acid-binding protein